MGLSVPGLSKAGILWLSSLLCSTISVRIDSRGQGLTTCIFNHLWFMYVWLNIKVFYTGINLLIDLAFSPCFPQLFLGTTCCSKPVHRSICYKNVCLHSLSWTSPDYQLPKSVQTWEKNEMFAIITGWLLAMFFTGVTRVYKKSRLLAKGLWTREHCFRIFSSHRSLYVLCSWHRGLDKWICRIPLAGVGTE